jgi:hypothetical protein
LRILLRAEPRSEIEMLNDQKGERGPSDQRDDEQAQVSDRMPSLSAS